MGNYARAIINNSIIVSAIDSRDIVDEVIQLQGLSPVCADALGRVLTIVALMGKQLKNSGDYLTTTVSGDGAIGSMTAYADIDSVKGYADNSMVDNIYDAYGKLDVASAVGKQGRITVIKDIGLKQPYVGTADLVCGNIVEDFANYFATSQQQACALTVGIALSREGHCKSAGGVLVEVMPDCDDELLFDVETVLYAMDEMSYQFDNSTAREVVQRFFGKFEDLKFVDESNVVYRCNCSRDKMTSVIRGLGKQEAISIIDELSTIEIHCHFCNTKHVFDREQVEQIFYNDDNQTR